MLKAFLRLLRCATKVRPVANSIKSLQFAKENAIDIAKATCMLFKNLVVNYSLTHKSRALKSQLTHDRYKHLQVLTCCLFSSTSYSDDNHHTITLQYHPPVSNVWVMDVLLVLRLTDNTYTI